MAEKKNRIDVIKMILEDENIAREEDEVLHLLLQERVSKNPVADHEEKFTLGQRMADNLAKAAGSWVFIGSFGGCLVLWIAVNAAVLLNRGFDPYPFILLNLVLSCLAAIQAPVIMMAQNRQEEKDRLRAKNDYKVNLKAEIIIEDIHEKLDDIIASHKELIKRINDLEKGQK